MCQVKQVDDRTQEIRWLLPQVRNHPQGASIKDLQIADTHNAFSENSKKFIHILEIV